MSIEIRNVNKRFGDFVALEDINVSLPTGQLTALLGPSGGGKSTLLRIIAGLEQADTGAVEHRGRRRHADVAAEAQRRLRVPALRGVQAHDRGEERRVRAGDPQEVQGRGARARRRAVKLVHLSQFADRLPSQLSGGQRQRMALARALAVQPKVLLLDEPFGALDAKVRKELREWLRRLHDEVPVTTVFVTHDQEEAMEVADEIVVINDGRIEQVGTPDSLYDEPANDFVMDFLGEVTQLGELRLRPHDIEISLNPDLAGSMSADILRLTRVGFEVRLVAGSEEGQEISVVTTRAHARALDLEEGQRVWLTPSNGAATVPAMKSLLVG